MGQTLGIWAASEAALERVAADLGCDGVVVPHEDEWADLYAVVVEQGESHTPDAFLEGVGVAFEPIERLEEAGWHGVRVRTRADAASLAQALLEHRADIDRLFRAAEDLSELATDLGQTAQRIHDHAVGCSSLAPLDDRCWALARRLRRQAAQVHARVPAVRDQISCLRNERTLLDDGLLVGETALLDHRELWHFVAPADAPEIDSSITHASDRLDVCAGFLEETERLLAVLCDEADAHQSQSLNVVVYWLGLVTLALGLVAMWDKYQTDQAFGLPVDQAALVVSLLTAPLIAAFAVVAYRHGLLADSVRRRVRPWFQRRAHAWAWRREARRINRGQELHVDGRWHAWFEQALALLIHGTCVQLGNARIAELPAAISAHEDDLFHVVQTLWASIELRELVFVDAEEGQLASELTAADVVDRLWNRALLDAAIDSLWVRLPRPMPPAIWAGLLLRARVLIEPPQWTWSWRWSDVEGGETRAGRERIRAAVSASLRSAWETANGAPLPLDDVCLWDELSSLDVDDEFEEALVAAIEEMDFFDGLRASLNAAETAAQ